MILILVLVVVLSAGCGPIASIRDSLLQTPPYERYVSMLASTGLDRTPVGAAWIETGRRALGEENTTALAGTQSEVVRSEQPRALAYRLQLRRGQTYTVVVASPGGVRINTFIDLFESGNGLARVASAGPPVDRMAFEPLEDGAYLLRIQPELLASGRLLVSQSARAALLFPVTGAGRRNIQSFFGAARSGAREHQGIDIFAPRGTPVVAAADGWVSSTSPNKLGGNVVWLWDPRRGHTLYYAHLDRHAVAVGDRVRRGDIVGYVGNTGNARTTAPHLHFGIYRRGAGAIDPLIYVVNP